MPTPQEPSSENTDAEQNQEKFKNLDSKNSRRQKN